MSNTSSSKKFRADATAKGWLAALADGIHMADNAGNAWLKEKLGDILVHMGGALPDATGDAAGAPDAEPGRINRIDIERDDGNAVITYRDAKGIVIDQTIFEDDAISISTSVATFLESDAIRGPLKEHLNEWTLLNATDLDDKLSEVVSEVFGFRESEDEADHLMQLARDIFKELQGD